MALAALHHDLVPSVVLANAGTPLMWAGALHLLVGNMLIGIIEGSLLSWLFKTPRGKSIMLLVVANYVSAWGGGVGIVEPLAHIPDITIVNARLWLCLFVAVAFIITVIIELPFFWHLFRGRQNSLWRAGIAALLIHGISYSMLFVWYWAASGTSMLTQLEVVPARELLPKENYALYFITPDGARAVKSDLAGSGMEVVRSLSARGRHDRLFVRPGKGGGFDLFVLLNAVEGGGKTEELIAGDFADLAAIEWNIEQKPSVKAEDLWLNFGSVPSLASATDWKCHAGFWAVEGIYGENERIKHRFQFSLETPFAQWAVRNATQIEGNCVVFQLGYDQICILQPHLKKIALIARGKGPVVARQKGGRDVK